MKGKIKSFKEVIKIISESLDSPIEVKWKVRDLPLTERPPWNEHQNCSSRHPRKLSKMRGVFGGGCVI